MIESNCKKMKRCRTQAMWEETAVQRDPKRWREQAAQVPLFATQQAKASPAPPQVQLHPHSVMLMQEVRNLMQTIQNLTHMVKELQKEVVALRQERRLNCPSYIS